MAAIYDLMRMEKEKKRYRIKITNRI